MLRDWRVWGLLTAVLLVLCVLIAWAVANDRKLWAMFVGVPYFKPGSALFRELFTRAAAAAEVPSEWAESEALAQLVAAESGGWVGIPNFTWNNLFGSKYSSAKNAAAWPALWPGLRKGNWPAVDKSAGFTSRAIGIGQLQPANIAKYYPSGYRGVGVPLEEAVGTLRYIADRHGDPEAAWTHHKLHGSY